MTEQNKSESSVPPSASSKIRITQQQALAGAAILLLTGLPTTLAAITDPVMRFGCTVIGFLVIFWVGLRLVPPKK